MLKNRATLQPSNCTTGYLPQRYRRTEKKGHVHSNVHSSIVHKAKPWKEPIVPSTDEWIKKMWSIYTMGYYSAIRKNDYATFAATWTGVRLC